MRQKKLRVVLMEFRKARQVYLCMHSLDALFCTDNNEQ